MNYPFIFPLHFKSVPLPGCLSLRLKFAQVSPRLKESPITLLQAPGQSMYLSFSPSIGHLGTPILPHVTFFILTYSTFISARCFLALQG